METTIQIALNVILFGCMAYLIFFKDYIKKKGINLADKQDIADITKQIEMVKKEFNQENEHLKANLQFIISNQIQHSNEERNAIINFFDNYSKWVNVGLLDIKLNEYNFNNIDDLKIKYRELNDFYTQTSVSRNRISLLMNDEEIIDLSHSLLIAALNFTHWNQKLMFQLRLNLERHNRGNSRFLELIKIDKIGPEAEELAKEEQQLIYDRKQINSKFNAERNIEHRKIIGITNQFTNAIKLYFNKRNEDKI